MRNKDLLDALASLEIEYLNDMNSADEAMDAVELPDEPAPTATAVPSSAYQTELSQQTDDLEVRREVAERHITDLREFEREYRIKLRTHLKLLEEMAPDDWTRERVVAFLAMLDDPNHPAGVLQ